ncbi:porin [Pandoraea pnomenusa]|uniref:porin n=1 Tax=Pandoraea pnomenusa TaxID=93220 RepID=UPI003340B7A1
MHFRRTSMPMTLGRSKSSAAVALTATLAFVAPSVFAQSNVQLYGLIDSGVEYVNHIGDGQSVVRIPAGGGEFPSRWGIRGTEDLGGGTSAIFTLESGFNVRAGDMAQGGRLFGRQAFVGLKGQYGTLAFGRQYNMTYVALANSTILGPDMYGMGNLDTYLPNARTDNTITYQGAYRELSFGASYSFGRDSTGTGNTPGQGTCAGSVAGQSTQCRDWTVMLKYERQGYGIAASYDEQRGGPGATAYFFDGLDTIPLSSSADKDARAHVGVFGRHGNFRFGAGWVNRRVTIASGAYPDVHSNLYFAGLSYQPTAAWLFDGELYRIINPDHDSRATMGSIRMTYSLSIRTAVYAQATYIANSAKARYSSSGGGGGTTPNPGVGQMAAMVGMRHSF